ncbi:hypothetical protein M422DRAFT_172845, partial [Sphaerobolus stellatus SS14]
MDVDFTKDEIILRLLETTPYFPSYANKQSLHTIIEEQAKIVSDLNAKINELKPQLESLEKARNAADKKLQNVRSLLAPIRKIPAEILSEILYLAAENPGYINQFFDEDDWRYHFRANSVPQPFSFLGVCKSWRSIALGTTRLFTQIDLRGKCSGALSEVVTLYMDHSGTLPLEVLL